MLKVGITGGIGSGKSYVCDIFKKLGVPVFHADNVSRKIVESDFRVKLEISKLFGAGIYTNGYLNRSTVSERVFKDKKLLEKLNAIIHPAVFNSFLIWTDDFSNKPYVLKEAAIIFESGAEKNLNFVITVTAPEELRLTRVVNRDQVDSAKVMARIKNQWKEEERVKKSDFVIVNDDKTLLLPQINIIHNSLLEEAAKV